MSMLDFPACQGQAKAGAGGPAGPSACHYRRSSRGSRMASATSGGRTAT